MFFYIGFTLLTLAVPALLTSFFTEHFPEKEDILHLKTRKRKIITCTIIAEGLRFLTSLA